MNEQITSSFIWYLAIFRLAIIGAGITSIIIGYKLFAKGFFPQGGTGTGTEAEADAVGIRLKLKNAAPGTVFSFFGMLIIVVMYVAGPPELTLENVTQPATVIAQSDTSQIPQSWKVKMRSQGSESVQIMLERAKQAQQAGDTVTALSEYKNAIQSADLALNQAAWLSQAQGRLEDAYALARTAVLVSPNDADIRDTYAEILFEKGNFQKAWEQGRKAAELASQYEAKIQKYKEAYENHLQK